MFYMRTASHYHHRPFRLTVSFPRQRVGRRVTGTCKIRPHLHHCSGQILVCGTDGDKDAIDSVNNGELTATVAQDPANIGVVGLRGLIDAVANPDTYPASAEPEKTPVEAVLVTKE